MDANKEFKRWLNYGQHPADIARELADISEQPQEIQSRFTGDLDFGTGGLRGILGAGTRRMNVHTIRKAARALALHTLSHNGHAVVIGYDCRRMSREFAIETACTCVAAGLHAYVFEHLCPTPELSFAVRALNASAGVMITASHNPPMYNGFKVYGPDGGQILPDVAGEIRSEMSGIENVFEVPVAPLDVALATNQFRWIGAEVDAAYVKTVREEVANTHITPEQRAAVRLVYTPLHGTGNLPVRSALAEAGFADVFVVEAQEAPDGEFPTVISPNPEEPEALEAAIRLAKEVEADVVFGTDPDADRVGIAARNAHGDFVLFTGNQLGGLLIDYLLGERQQRGTLPEDGTGVVYQTIVTSRFGKTVAESYGVAVEETLTGFKYIGARITEEEARSRMTFLFGYEESYGYLLSGIVRDKDAVQACLAVADMSAFYKARGIDLPTALEHLYARVGYFAERLLGIHLSGDGGLETSRRLLEGLQRKPLHVQGFTLAAVEDYQMRLRTCYTAEGVVASVTSLTLPESDVQKFVFADGSWIAVRPSGTEPKLKVYVATQDADRLICHEKLSVLVAAVEARLRERT